MEERKGRERMDGWIWRPQGRGFFFMLVIIHLYTTALGKLAAEGMRGEEEEEEEERPRARERGI